MPAALVGRAPPHRLSECPWQDVEDHIRRCLDQQHIRADHEPLLSRARRQHRDQLARKVALGDTGWEGPAASDLLGNAGRNSIVGPNLFNVDFTVHKDFAVTKISEAFKVQFRTEFFNILNHANFTPPLPFFGSGNAQIFNSNGTLSGGGGLQQPLATRPRIIQFALKVIW